MKKRILLFTLVAGMGAFAISSYTNGPGANGFDCTGADVNSGTGNPTGCSASGFSCHGSVGGATAGIKVVLELDSAGVVSSTTASGTGHYKPGYTYTVKITGTNTTTNSLPKFGFQVAATKGATAATSPANAGTFQSTGLPAGVAYVTAPGTSNSFYANVVEHNTPLSPTTGTGTTGTTYVESFTWTAPAAGTGTVSLFGALNAVNNNGVEDAGDLWNTAQLVLDEETTPSSVANVMNNTTVIAFPNPVSNTLQVQLNEATEGAYALQVYGMDGRMVANENVVVSGKNYSTSINTGNWAPGVYSVVLSKDGSRKMIAVVKQ